MKDVGMLGDFIGVDEIALPLEVFFRGDVHRLERLHRPSHDDRERQWPRAIAKKLIGAHVADLSHDQLIVAVAHGDAQRNAAVASSRSNCASLAQPVKHRRVRAAYRQPRGIDDANIDDERRRGAGLRARA